METAYTLLRIALGLNIFMHGFTRLHAGSKLFRESVQKEFADSILPAKLVGAFGIIIVPLEAAIGGFLLLGIFTEYTIVTGSVLMLILIFGKSLKSDWQTVSFQMIYVAFYAALAFLRSYNDFSLDKLFF